MTLAVVLGLNPAERVHVVIGDRSIQDVQFSDSALAVVAWPDKVLAQIAEGGFF
jgi:hypothetical protein